MLLFLVLLLFLLLLAVVIVVVAAVGCFCYYMRGRFFGENIWFSLDIMWYVHGANIVAAAVVAAAASVAAVVAAAAVIPVVVAILSCERKTQAVLAQTIILSGGTTEMVGLNRRLQRELTKTSR